MTAGLFTELGNSILHPPACRAEGIQNLLAVLLSTVGWRASFAASAVALLVLAPIAWLAIRRPHVAAREHPRRELEHFDELVFANARNSALRTCASVSDWNAFNNAGATLLSSSSASAHAATTRTWLELSVSALTIPRGAVRRPI
jgi:hypothetical protein